jgi:threonine dehydratase
MVTTIDVIDSAVKIGLGALISGLATYLVAKSSHDKTIAKERAQRKRDMLEAVAQHVTRHWMPSSPNLAASIEEPDLRIAIS